MTFDEAEKLAFEKAATLCKHPENGTGVLWAFQHGDEIDVSIRAWFGSTYQLAQLQESVAENNFSDVAASAFHVVSLDEWNDAEYDYSCADGVPRLCWHGYWDEQVVASFPYDAPKEEAVPPLPLEDDAQPF